MDLLITFHFANVLFKTLDAVCIQWLAAKVDLCIPSGSLNISVISQLKWLKFGLQPHLLKMKVTKVFVVYLVISTKCFITIKVQEIESWNFACSNILKGCAWRPSFNHFSWEVTKISTVPVQHRCPTYSIGHSTWIEVATFLSRECDYYAFGLRKISIINRLWLNEVKLKKQLWMKEKLLKLRVEFISQGHGIFCPGANRFCICILLCPLGRRFNPHCAFWNCKRYARI